MTYIAMNRFRVAKGGEEEFEQVWRSRESYLSQLKGFVSFSLLRGPENEDHTLFSSHTVWDTHQDFEVWTKSEQFRMAHANAGNGRKLPIMGHPQFEGFHVVLHEDNTARVAPAA